MPHPDELAKLFEMKEDLPRAYLRVPPFPGAKVRAIARPRSHPAEALSEAEVDRLAREMDDLKVGGDYWQPQPAKSSDLRASVRNGVQSFEYVDPFTGAPMSIAEAIRLCGFWKDLIDSNRDIGSAVGFAFWKRPTVAPLLWDGAEGPRFVSRMKDVDTTRAVAVWKARTGSALLGELESCGAPLIEVEDGFIRSSGLGADCVPPLSIVVDRHGAHFDAGKPSELEALIERGPFSPELLERAARLRELIVAAGLGKYGAGRSNGRERASNRRQILVPGQVEDDRAVLSGLGDIKTNLALLHCVRAANPDAHVIYKPHPDVEAGHRAGTLRDEEILRHADEIVRDDPMTALIQGVDEIHVISSLAGFEALMRGKAVTTYGTPFYAGWGLTKDLGPVPASRTARRSLDELVAAVLLLYPRYLDPVSGLPCPPEVLVRRLAEGATEQDEGLVVHLRRLQGRLKKRLAQVGLGR